jgi:hypothetical protein
MTPREADRRLYLLEGKAGLRRNPALDARQAKALDGWLVAVTGKRVDELSNDELRRLEQLFRDHADSGEPMGDDAADLVLGCMDENQTVIDLDQRRQQLDQPPWR